MASRPGTPGADIHSTLHVHANHVSDSGTVRDSHGGNVSPPGKVNISGGGGGGGGGLGSTRFGAMGDDVDATPANAGHAGRPSNGTGGDPTTLLQKRSLGGVGIQQERRSPNGKRRESTSPSSMGAAAACRPGSPIPSLLPSANRDNATGSSPTRNNHAQSPHANDCAAVNPSQRNTPPRSDHSTDDDRNASPSQQDPVGNVPHDADMATGYANAALGSDEANGDNARNPGRQALEGVPAGHASDPNLDMNRASPLKDPQAHAADAPGSTNQNSPDSAKDIANNGDDQHENTDHANTTPGTVVGHTNPPLSLEPLDVHGSPELGPRFLDDAITDERIGDIMERSLEAIYSVQRMAELLIAGPDVEREFILFELQQLLDHCPDDTMKILLPVLCEHVPSWNIDLQTKAAQRLFDVVSLELDPPTVKMVTRAAFGVVQSGIANDDPAVANLYDLCGVILVDVLPNMPWTSVEVSDVFALVDVHAKQPLFCSRKFAGRILGALSNCFDASRVERTVLPRALRLFDDTDLQVRGVVVESMAAIGAALPIRVTETEIWPRVERLLDPTENARIHATALQTLAHILQKQREKGATGRLFKDLLPPVFNKISSFAKCHAAEDQRDVDDDTYMLLEVVSEVFGQFVFSLSQFARRSYMKDAYKAYGAMATCNGPVIRRHCAYNLPGVAKALGEKFAGELSGLCEFLARDMDEDVRYILAAGIHESATLLVPRGIYNRLFNAVCSLLEDENPQVRMNALSHFHELLTAFVRNCPEPASIRRLVPVFVNLSMLSEGNWRIQKRLAEQLDKCAEVLPPDALIGNVLPLLYRLTEEGTPLVRRAAMAAIARALRNIPSLPDRNSAVSNFWKNACDGPFWMRLALLDGGVAAQEIFSSPRFRELFAPTVLGLAADPVTNVRIRVASMMPVMAPVCLSMPEFATALERLRNDKDGDVIDLMMAYPAAAEAAQASARESSAADATKYREEQEFYGITPRTAKRVRGRLNNMRTGRMLSNHSRRQNSDYQADQSSGQLSVSQSVISAAKATSAAASAGIIDGNANGMSLTPTTRLVPSSLQSLGPGAVSVQSGPVVPAAPLATGSTSPSAPTTESETNSTSSLGLSIITPSDETEREMDRDDDADMVAHALETSRMPSDADTIPDEGATVPHGSEPEYIAAYGTSPKEPNGRSAFNRHEEETRAGATLSDPVNDDTSDERLPSGVLPDDRPVARKSPSLPLEHMNDVSGPPSLSELSDLAHHANAVEVDSKSTGHLPSMSPSSDLVVSGPGNTRRLGGSTVVVQQASRDQRGRGPKVGREVEARAKSWSERFAQIPRQLSMESRGKGATAAEVAQGAPNVAVGGAVKGTRTGSKAPRSKSFAPAIDPGTSGSTKPSGSSNASFLARKRKKKVGTAAPAGAPSSDLAEASSAALYAGKGSGEAVRGPSVADAIRRFEAGDAATQAPSSLPVEPRGARSERAMYGGASRGRAEVAEPTRPVAHEPPITIRVDEDAGAPLRKTERAASMMAYVPGEGTGNAMPQMMHVEEAPLPHMSPGYMERPTSHEPQVMGRGASMEQPMLAMSARSISVDDRKLQKGQLALELGVSEAGIYNGVPVSFDAETGLPTFKGAAPWMRRDKALKHVRHPDGQQIPIAELAASSPASRHHPQAAARVRPGKGGVPSFHSEVAHPVSAHHKAINVTAASGHTVVSGSDGSAVTSEGGTGRFRGLFGRRRR